jgi:hypothetical protein
MLSYQIGSLFHENRNSINFQFLDNLYFNNFSCGHDFVVAQMAIVDKNINHYTSN